MEQMKDSFSCHTLSIPQENVTVTTNTLQWEKKAVCVSPGLVNFVVGLVNSILLQVTRQGKFLRKLFSGKFKNRSTVNISY